MKNVKHKGSSTQQTLYFLNLKSSLKYVNLEVLTAVFMKWSFDLSMYVFLVSNKFILLRGDQIGSGVLSVFSKINTCLSFHREGGEG
jgi:hypothetical protein